MKNSFRIFLILMFILACVGINISYARYRKTLQSDDAVITSKSSTPLTATITVQNENENIYNISVTNNNPYAVRYKIKELEDTLNIKYGDTEDEYATISANTTQTSSVKFSDKLDIIYKNAQKDSAGNIYININIAIQGIKPYLLNELQIATNTKIYLEKNLKNNVISRERNK